MTKLIRTLFPLLFIAGGAWWFLLREEGPDDGEPEAAVAAPPPFVDLEPMLVPVVRDGGVRRLIKIDLAVELRDAAATEASAASGGKGEGGTSLPHLTDVFMSELYALFGRRQMEERQYDLAIVKRRLQSAADRVLGEGRVVAVLIQGMVVAPVR